MMNILLVLILISGCIYAGYVFYFLTGLGLLKKVKILPLSERAPFLGIVIPARNEAKNIEKTIRSLAAQNYPADRYKIVVVDDRSFDRTPEILIQLEQEISNLEVIHLIEKAENISPKKNALIAGIDTLDCQFVITTDADCEYHPDWLLTYARAIEENPEAPGLIAALTVFHKESYTTWVEQFWQEMQYVDYISHSLIAAGCMARQRGFTANGSNMAFKRELYNKFIEKVIKTNIASGDDYFLVQAASKEKLALRFLTDEESIVKSQPAATLSELLHQRARWASKTAASSDFVLIFALNTFAFYSSLLILPFLCSFGLVNWSIFGALLLLKISPEAIFLAYGHGKFNLKFNPFIFLALEVFHIPFNLAAGIKGAFFGFTWKGERFKK